MTTTPATPRKGATVKDDRYRLNQTPEAILSSFEEVRRDYGREIAIDEQVAICRRLSAAVSHHGHSGPLTRSDILGAFESIGLRRPPNGFARDLIARLERVVG